MIRKKFSVIVIILTMCFALIGCGASVTDPSDNDGSTDSDQSQLAEQEVTLEDIISQNAAKALYDRLVNSFESMCNAAATKYSIATIEYEPAIGYVVRGKFYMYDKFGEPVSNYFPGTFLVFTDTYGNVDSDNYNSVVINMG